MPHAKIARVTIKQTVLGQVCENVLHFGTDSLSPNWEQLALDIIDCIRTTLAPHLAQEYRLDEIDVTQIFPDLLDPLVVIPTTAVAGENFSPSLPTTNAVVLSLLTGGGGRSGRGRMYIPAVEIAAVQGNDLKDIAIGYFIAFLACMFGKFVTAGDPPVAPEFFWGIQSRKNYATEAHNLHFRDLKSYKVQKILGTMRSRREGRGI
jgi:hypothetical protein